MYVFRKDLWIVVLNEDYDRVKENIVVKLKKVQFVILIEVQEKRGLGYFGKKKFKFDIEDKIVEKIFRGKNCSLEKFSKVMGIMKLAIMCIGFFFVMMMF